MPPIPADNQTVHPLANRTLGQLADIANAAEKGGETLYRDKFSPFEWVAVVQFVLTIRDLPSVPDAQIASYKSTADIASA
jgi:hypothetical protein